LLGVPQTADLEQGMVHGDSTGMEGQIRATGTADGSSF
jgi:hypothetical protein